MGDREEFLQIWQQHITRPGSEKLLDWLDHKTDFFTAPASTRFHGACEGGLCMHSLNVYHALHDTFLPRVTARRPLPSVHCCTICARPTTTSPAPAT